MAQRRSPTLTEQLQRLRPWAPAVPGVLLLMVTSLSFGRPLVDDAYISLTYAGNLANGDGLVFHPSLPRTEGYSNLLWTLLLSLGLKLGAPGGELAGTLCGVFSAAVIALLSRRIGGARGAAVGVALALSPIFGYWSIRGLEGGLVALLLLLGVLGLGQRWGWLCFGLLGVARVEGVVWGALAALHAWRRGARRPDPTAAALWLGPTLLQLAFRGLYYGALLPAPLLAKAKELNADLLRKGLMWLSGALTGDPVLLVLLVVGVVLAVRATLKREPLDKAPWALLGALGLVAFGVGVGGDWMPNLRWLMPAVPLVWLAAHELIPQSGPFMGLVGLGALLGSQTGIITLTGDSAPRQWASAVEILTRGRSSVPIHPAHLFVLEYLTADDVVVQPDVGLLSWLTGNPILDPQGLTWRDAAIAQRYPPDAPEHQEAVVRIRQDLERLRPALIGLTVHGDRPAGPASEALLGSRPDDLPVEWFRKGWVLWREQVYSPGIAIRYYLRSDITDRLPSRARLKRYEDALGRAPEASALQSRVVWTLKQLDRMDEARALDMSMDPRDRQLGETWTR